MRVLPAPPTDKVAVRCDATFCLDPECNDVHLRMSTSGCTTRMTT